MLANIIPFNSLTAFAATSFESSDVLTDLKSSDTFDEADYPKNPLGRLSIINVVEYAFSANAQNRGKFGIYLYIYNPALINIEVESGQNKLQLAVGYDSNGKPNSYEKYEIKLISSSEDKLFLKYKLVDHKVNEKTLDERVNSKARRYDISGIELLTAGKTNATEYTIGGTYTFTGFAKGFGENATAESDLNCTVENLETVRLNLGHTAFRTNVSSAGAHHYNQLSSVYFSVPNDLLEKYGNLNRIACEWWEYKTAPIVVTSNKNVYNELLKNVGKDVGEYTKTVPLSMFYGRNEISYVLGSTDRIEYDWSYNIKQIDLPKPFDPSIYSSKINTLLPYAFYSPTATNLNKAFDFLASFSAAGDVSEGEVSKYIYNYRNPLGNGYIDCNGRKISNDLFEANVDKDRQRGYNRKNIFFDDTFDLKSYDSNHDWWDKFWDYRFKQPETSGDYLNIAPIVSFNSKDLEGNRETVAQNLLVNVDSLYAMKRMSAAASLSDKTMFLLRFATTDYYARNAGYKLSGQEVLENKTDTYIAQETVFLDFDVIELEFTKDGVYHVIPAVSSPIDAIGGITAPILKGPNLPNIIMIIIIIVLSIIALILFYPLIIEGIVGIFKAIWWIVTAPARGIKALIDRRK